jgi:hypothetical protein
MLALVAVALDIPSTITALTGLVAAVAAMWSVIHNGKTLKQVDSRVETVNGRSIGILAELAEGRRIRRDIPSEQQTVREMAYVTLLEKVEREGSTHEVAEDAKLNAQGQLGEGPGAPPAVP